MIGWLLYPYQCIKDGASSSSWYEVLPCAVGVYNSLIIPTLEDNTRPRSTRLRNRNVSPRYLCIYGVRTVLCTYRRGVLSTGSSARAL